MKRLTAILLVCGVLCVSLTSCGRASDQIGQESISVATESDVNEQNVSEDYVYDYQVSMEPIPKEIADLGGPCQGTIHAFPSKIRMGLTQKMMEEDPELKAEVEKRIPEIEQALVENIGGEFSVDGVIVEDDLEWKFFCTEVSSEYEFCLTYFNMKYVHRNESNWVTMDNKIFIDGYYEPQKTEDKKGLFNQLISESFEESCNIAWIGGVSKEIVTIHIAQFTDKDIDKSEEQVKVLNLWEDLKEYNDEALYGICISYYPTIYQEIMEKKFATGYLYDIGKSSECSEALLARGELIDEIWYDDLIDGKGDMGLDVLLKQYQEGKYKENKIWPYWLSK